MEDEVKFLVVDADADAYNCDSSVEMSSSQDTVHVISNVTNLDDTSRDDTSRDDISRDDTGDSKQNDAGEYNCM